MKISVYAIYDSKSEIYSQPMFMLNKGTAIRSWTDTANDPQSNVHKHAADFTLFEIGTWEDTTGIITMHDAKISLGVALEFKKVESFLQNIQNAGNITEIKEIQQ